MSELTDRLRAWAYTTGPLGSPRSLLDEAADALDAAEAELTRLRTRVVQSDSAWTFLDITKRRLNAAEAKLAAIDALHLPEYDDSAWGYCQCDGFTWPCPTHRILHPEECDVDFCPDCGAEYTAPCGRHENVSRP